MFFKKKEGPKLPKETVKREPPDNLWIKCESCGEILYKKHLEKNLWVCPNCGYHFRIDSSLYMRILLDDGELLEEYATDLKTVDWLNFPGYKEKLESLRKKTGLDESARVGKARIGGHDVVFFITDFRFLAGSMGAVMGERFYVGAVKAIEMGVPYISLTASGGGARMHEGIVSLMQMAKTTVAVIKMEEAGIPFISILTDPTMGGVMASFAALGDVIIAEKGALIGFAGPRVIKQTIRQDLPPGFQRSEFLMEKGQLDIVVSRHDLRNTLIRLLDTILKSGRAERS